MSFKIAVIEDDQPIRLMYVLKLQRAGFEVFSAENGVQGLAIARKVKPDLILLDLRMPVMDGDEMLMKLRATPWGSNIRIIILTNISKNEAPQALRFLHVDGYIVKAHYTPAQVVEVVQKILFSKI